MNKQQFLVSLSKAANQRRNRCPNQKVWDNLVGLSGKGNGKNHNFNAFLKDLRGSSLPFV
jgi:hypothetical protein